MGQEGDHVAQLPILPHPAGAMGALGDAGHAAQIQRALLRGVVVLVVLDHQILGDGGIAVDQHLRRRRAQRKRQHERERQQQGKETFQGTTSLRLRRKTGGDCLLGMPSSGTDVCRYRPRL